MLGFLKFVLLCSMNAISMGCGAVYTDDYQIATAWHGIIALWIFLITIFVALKILGFHPQENAKTKWAFPLAALISFSLSILYFFIVYLLI